MTGTISPWWAQQWFDNNGDPLSSGKIYTYAAGTVTPLATYTDATLDTENANPVILDSSGRGSVFLGPSSYKFVLKDSTDATILTVDGVAAVPLTNIDLDIIGTAGQDLAMNDVVFMSDGTGGNTAGRWYKADADATLSSTTAKVIGMTPAAILTGESGSIRRAGRVEGLAGLNPGTDYYISGTAGAITSTAPANGVLVGTADSTTSLIIPGRIPDASATIAGVVNTGAQTFAGVKTLTSPILNTPAFASLPTGVGAIAYGASAANFTKNANTTLGDVTGIAFAVAANATYLFQMHVTCSAAVAAANKFAVTGPAAPTSVLISYLTRDSSNGDDAFATATTMTALGAGVYQLVLISGYLVNGANAGTVQLQYAQQTSDASDAIVYAGSYAQAWRVA